MTALLPDTGTEARPARAELSLPLVVTSLMRGVVYRETAPEVWRHLLALQPDLRDHVAVLGLVPVVDETEGFAFLRQRPEEEPDGVPVPRLVARRSLSFPVSLLLALLRRRLAAADAGEAGSRLVLSRMEIVDLLADVLPDPGRRNRLVEQVDGHVAKAVELGFLRRMPGPDGGFEVRRVLKAFVDAQWLADFDAKLAEYAAATQQLQPAVEDLP
ncbi:DUF4194 domain-containing protein [Klenkia sp. PcliD-1-E]|uniref:DUF4194 domain-containing protein n=1 Tax=Klenkia sp. PcliD-1-E TaxID=2954492 RepID=UPI0020968ED5|nr:DUF4194 domain-containing protein [Klenkia sp. PcliD-1-E]MCO7218448.1 DUF4194 domain-containing protein [Klenkia sp. PcliD-1-E]